MAIQILCARTISTKLHDVLNSDKTRQFTPQRLCAWGQSIVMPETPIQEEEEYADWLFRAKFHYELLLMVSQVLILLMYSFDGTECLDYVSRFVCVVKTLQLLSNTLAPRSLLPGLHREKCQPVIAITCGAVLMLAVWIKLDQAGTYVCAPRSMVEFDVMWNHAIAVVSITSSLMGLNIGLRNTHFSLSFLVGILATIMAEFCSLWMVFRAQPFVNQTRSNEQHAEHVLSGLMVPAWCLILGISCSTFLVRRVWYNKFLIAKTSVTAAGCNSGSASSTGKGTGCGAGDDVDTRCFSGEEQDTEPGAFELDWSNYWNYDAATEAQKNSCVQDILSFSSTRCKAPDSDVTLSESSMTTSISSCEPQPLSIAINNSDTDAERPPKKVKTGTCIDSPLFGDEQSDLHAGIGVAFLHPGTGDMVTSNSEFTSLAAQDWGSLGDLKVIAKRLVVQLRVAIVTTGQNMLPHDEVGPGGLRVQGKAMFAGQFIMWIIYKYELNQDCSTHETGTAYTVLECSNPSYMNDDNNVLEIIQSCSIPQDQTPNQLTYVPFSLPPVQAHSVTLRSWQELKFDQKGPDAPKPTVFKEKTQGKKRRGEKTSST